jgi:hypothetical protein
MDFDAGSFMEKFKASHQSVFDEFKTCMLENSVEKESRMAEASVAQAAVEVHKEAVAEAHEEVVQEEEAVATHMQISATRTIGTAKRITAKQPGAETQLVAAVLQQGGTIKAQKEATLAATLTGEPPTSSDPAVAIQLEAAPVVALGTLEVTLDVPRHGALGATRPWLSACSLRTSCFSGRGV